MSVLESADRSRSDVLVDLRRRLEIFRRRLFVKTLLTGVAFGTSAAAAVAWVVALAGVTSTAILLFVLLGAIAAAAGVAALTAWRRTPDLAEAARRVERVLGAGTVLSTAWEYGPRPAWTWAERVLKDAVLEDAGRVVPTVDGRSLIPLRFRLVHVTTLTVTVVALGATAFQLRASRLAAQSIAPPRPQALVLDDPTVLAQELDRLADALSAEADLREDPYVGALAEAARDLARSLRADVSARDAAGVANDLESLLGHIGEAIGPRFAPRAPPAADRAPLDMAQVEFPSAPPGEDASAQSGQPDVDRLASQVSEVTRRLEEAQTRRVDNPYGASFEPEARAAGNEVRDERAREIAQGDARGAPAGAAERSSDAPGDAAGGGSHELSDGSPEPPPTFEGAEEVRIPDAAVTARGPRVRSQGDPDGAEDVPGGAGASLSSGRSEIAADLDAAVADTVRDERGGWRSEALGPDARALASRLFAPDDEDR